MKRFSCYSLSMVFALGLAACGGGGDDDAPIDGGTTTDGTVIRLDGRVDSSTPDAGSPGMCNAGSTGTKAVFATCTADSECMAGSQCIALSTTRICLRCCDGTGTSPNPAQCDVGTSCTKQGLTGLSVPALENHCWFSFCGANYANGAGTLKSTCEVGKDLWEGSGATFTPGWCLTFDDGSGVTPMPRGSCTPAGNIAVDQTCTATSAPGTPQCATGNLCVGNMTAGFKCRNVCNPTTAADAECATAGQDCQDSSEVSGALVGTYGFCIEGKRCNVLNDADVHAENVNNTGCGGVTQAFGGALGTLPTNCLPTTAARPNGVCGYPRGTALTNGAAGSCKNSAQTLVTDFCGAGATCGAVSEATTPDVCRAWCNNPTAAGMTNATCMGGTNCKQYIYDNGATAATTDDTLAIGYGVCAP